MYNREITEHVSFNIACLILTNKSILIYRNDIILLFNRQRKLVFFSVDVYLIILFAGKVCITLARFVLCLYDSGNF